MFYSIKGKVTAILAKSIVVENFGIGYEIFVSKPCCYCVDDEVYLLLHYHHHEDNEYLVGFNSNKEKEIFDLLLKVNGIGPKSALSILLNVDFDEFLLAVSNRNFDYFYSIEGISSKIASQLVIDLKDHLTHVKKERDPLYKEIKEAFKSLKFKASEIDKVLPYVYSISKSKEEIFKETLRRLQNAKNI